MYMFITSQENLQDKFMIAKLYRFLVYILINLTWLVKPKISTNLYYKLLKKNGVVFQGMPNYISAKVWFDSADYTKIFLGAGITISSNVRILTHDWSPHTVRKAIGNFDEIPLGKLDGITIGDYTFVGTGTIIMPGCQIGKGVIVGAGSVVRGVVPDFSIVIGNPCRVIGDSREYVNKLSSKDKS